MTTDPKTRVGLIGVGLLGGALAGRLLDRGFGVLGTDIDRGKRAALRRACGAVAADAPEVVRGCERVLLSLPTGDVAAAVIDEVEGSLRPGQTVIDTTT